MEFMLFTKTRERGERGKQGERGRREREGGGERGRERERESEREREREKRWREYAPYIHVFLCTKLQATLERLPEHKLETTIQQLLENDIIMFLIPW